MKKSKIIIPALAMIAFSTAASISGAVAWFTASRQATISAGTYAVVKTNADLACTVTAGVGVVSVSNPDGDANRVVSLSDSSKISKLSDGSFNHEDKTFYTPSSDGKSFNVDKSGFAIGSSGWEEKLVRNTSTVAGVTTTIYTAVTWNMKFTVSFGAVSGDIGLFLDTPSSNYLVEGGADASTAKGFRTALIPATSAGFTKVYAPLQLTAKCTHVEEVGANDSMAGIPYDSDVLISKTVKDALAALPESQISETDAEARADYVGKFTYVASSKVDLEYTVVCWFEGTDEEIRNRALSTDYQSVVATLSFRALNLTA